LRRTSSRPAPAVSRAWSWLDGGPGVFNLRLQLTV
jgi:hypothetical protein